MRNHSRHVQFRGSKGLLAVAACAATLLQSVTSEGQAPQFDVASIKPNTSNSIRSTLDLQPGGRFIAVNVPLEGLVRVAYGDVGPLTRERLSSSAAWMRTDRFDIEAKASGDLTRDQMPAALRQLLADRFKLVVHHDIKELPMYALVLARPDGRLGPRLRRAAVDCSDPRNAPPAAADEKRACGFQNFPGKATGRVTMADLAERVLVNAVGDRRPVEDRTGLTGTFDFDLDWTPDQPAPARPAEAPAAPPIDPNGASVFTALQEQLGLKLEARKSTLDVLVVDSAERPSEN